MLEKWLIACNTLECTDFCHALFFTSQKKMSIAAISEMEVPVLTFQHSQRFKIIYTALWGMNYFPHYSLFPIIQRYKRILLFCRYSHGKCSDELRCLVLPAYTFAVQTHLATVTSTGLYSHSSLPYFISKKNVPDRNTALWNRPLLQVKGQSLTILYIVIIFTSYFLLLLFLSHIPFIKPVNGSWVLY